MSSGISRPAVLSGIVAIALAVPLAAGADVIVMKDGSRVASAGPWEVRGSMVVFKDDRGRLVSLQLDDVDVDASRQATEEAAGAVQREAAARAAATAAPVRQASIVVTDLDVAKASPAAPAASPGAPGEGAEAAAGEGDAATQAETPSRVVVSEWVKEFDEEGEGVTITGTLRNSDDTTTATNVRVVIELFDDEGRRITAVTVLGQPAALAPGGTGRFEAQVPGVQDFAAARFEARSLALSTGPSTPAVVPQQAYEERQREPDN